jgi:FdhD protein
LKKTDIKDESTELEKQIRIGRAQDGQLIETDDHVAVEEPLEIRIVFGPTGGRKTRTLAITMRTPGNDFELAAGFLVSERIVSTSQDIASQKFSGPVPDGARHANTVEVELAPFVSFEMVKLQRHFYTTSSCGICGKASLDAIRADEIRPIESTLSVAHSVIHSLPDQLRKQQDVFSRTGGLHAAGLATADGAMLEIREDIGRHNAVDKLIGSQLIEGRFPLREKILVLSGRASFELMQKALLASIPIVVAVGAPSSLAVELAIEFNVTLIGFTSQKRFNIYSMPSRIILD